MFVPKIIYGDLDSDYSNQKQFIGKQFDYASYLGLPSIAIDCPTVSSKSIASLASIVNSKLCLSGGLESLFQVWFCFDLSRPSTNGVQPDRWRQWNQLRNHLITSRKIGIVLELTNDDLPDDEQCQRWAGEPVKVLLLNTSSFLVNKKGYPVLSKRAQSVVSLLREKTAYELHLMVSGEPAENLELEHYYKYLEHLKSTQVEIARNTEFHKYAAGYEDFLQTPLQPLMDNLESTSYEVFEKDPVKYREYQRAITEALQTFESGELVLMVVGAGRGPLVTASIKAALAANKKLKLFAIEKNCNAMNTLNYLKKTCWDEYEHVQVEIVCLDMRDYNPTTKADVIVSELLGSLGDNELSPECLDGLWKCSKRDTISIPQTYTSYVAPIMSYRLHSRTLFDRDPSRSVQAAFESQYVVYLKNYYLIDQPQKLFTFDHFDMTIHPGQKDNRRFTTLNFKSKLSAVCHGFAGYFEATLFKDIKLSTVCGQETAEMFSWFPLWIPILEPFMVEPEDDLELMFWRNLDKQKVWYEWTVTSPASCKIHNINGRSQKIGL